MAKDEDARFRIDPLVVFKLGEELVSDETQALLELIKNAYDADASYVRVSINTTGAPENFALPADATRPGWIEIADDGVGMDDDAIRNGWLLIARSQKRDFKAAGSTTKKKRTPLGDKGLGRLGAQRLGWGLQIATKTADAPQEHVLAFSWEDFLTASTLDQVEITTDSRGERFKHGTVLTVSELHDPDRWTGQGVVDLQKELSEVISPYEGVSGFTVSVSVDGTPVNLQRLGEQVRETALLHYDITYDLGQLEVEGRATLGLFRPTAKRHAQEYHDLVEHDNGKGFYDYLRSSGADKKVGLQRGKGRWFVTFKLRRRLEDIDPELDDSRRAIDPGPFKAEVDSFSLAPGDDAALSVFGRLQEYRDFIKELAGVRVYRDGFVVRTDKDWLGLGAQWTSAASYYGLKPDTTLGYVAITSRDNAQLTEKTDREGFIDTPAYRNFSTLMSEFLRFTGEVQGLLRREYLEFAKSRSVPDAEPADRTPEAISDAIDDTLRDAEQLKSNVAAAQTQLTKAMTTARAAAKASDGEPTAETVRRTQDAAAVLRAAMEAAASTFDQLTEFLDRVDVAQKRNLLLQQEIAQLRAQLEDGIEAMGLGLTAEALSHEMFNIADNLSNRTRSVADFVADGKLPEPEIRKYIEYVRGSVGALRKELAHFAPSLRYVRDRREVIDLAPFVDEIASYYTARWSDRRIRLQVVDQSGAPFVVRGSRGRLTQIFDNLLLNSGYWLGTALERGTISQGKVTITLHRPFCTIADNGPGVEESVEDSLFDAFVTRKPRGQGRGLGLFIVRQLLESEDCSIALSDRRGKDGRRRDFVMNLGGILHDS